MYNPFKKYDLLSLVRTPGRKDKTTDDNLVSIYSLMRQQPSQPTNYSSANRGGIYDQYGNQIGSSAKRQTVNVPYTSPYQPTRLPEPKPQESSVPSYLQRYENLYGRRKQQAQSRLDYTKGYLNKAYDERNRLLQEAIPTLQKQFQQTQGYFQKGIDWAKQRAGIQKQNVEQEWGNVQRQAAQARRESEGRVAQRFAGLNTLGSYGFGSHLQAQENVESDFNRFTQENLRKAQQQKFEIDSQLQNYELDARKKIDELKFGLENTIRQIQSDIRMNDLEKQNAVQQAVMKYNDDLNSIDEWMNGIYENYQNKLAELAKNSLSEEFMRTGKPQTEADYQFFIKNYDKYKDMLGSGASDDQNKALNMVNTLLSDGAYKAVSGGWRVPDWMARLGIAGNAGQAKASWEGLKNLLALAKRGELKGSGAVSDFEAKMLQKAALAGLDPDKMSEEEFAAGLRRLQQDLMRAGAVANNYQRPSLEEFVQ